MPDVTADDPMTDDTRDAAGADVVPVEDRTDGLGDERPPEDAAGADVVDEDAEEPDPEEGSGADAPAVWNETVWTSSHLGLEPVDHVTTATVVTRSFPPYELASVLLALEELPGVVERAAFAYGDRTVLRRVDLRLRDGTRRLVADIGTRLAVEVDGEPAVVAAEVSGEPLGGVLVTVTAATAETARATHDAVAQAVELHASLWRKRSVVVNPYVLGLLESRDPATPDTDPADDPGGPVADDLRREIIDPLLAWERVAGVVRGRTVLLTGGVGTGKSSILRWLDQELDGKVTVVRASARVCMHPDLVRATFDLVAADPPGLVLVDDLDLAIGGVGAGPGTEAVVELADQLGGAGRRRGVFVVATAGVPAALEPTLGSRSGRFDRRLDLGAASVELRRTLLERMVGRHDGGAPDVLERLLARTGDWTASQLCDLERRAVLDAVRSGDPVDLLHALDPSSQRRGPVRDDGAGNYL